MSKSRIRPVLVAGAVFMLGSAIPATRLLQAQVRKCFVETCTTIGGRIVCSEHEVPCPPQT